MPSTEKDARVEDAVGRVSAYARAEGDRVKEGFVEGAGGRGYSDHYLILGLPKLWHAIAKSQFW